MYGPSAALLHQHSGYDLYFVQHFAKGWEFAPLQTLVEYPSPGLRVKQAMMVARVATMPVMVPKDCITSRHPCGVAE